jgi:hypothetical protein
MKKKETGNEATASEYGELKNIAIMVIVIIVILALLNIAANLDDKTRATSSFAIITIYWIVFCCEFKLGFVLHSRLSYNQYTRKKENPEKYNFHIKLHFCFGILLTVFLIIALIVKNI